MEKITKANYSSAVASGSVVVNVGASWCPDCRKIEPIMDAIDGENEKLKVYKVDFSEEESLKNELGINRIPTLIFYKDGQEVGQRLVEPGSKSEIMEQVNKII